MTWDEYEGVPIGIFIPGNIFGDLEVYKNSRRLFSCVAITRLETFSMTKKDFRRILFIKYPSIGKVYLSIMDFKLLELEKVMQIIVNCMFEGTRQVTPESVQRRSKSVLKDSVEKSPDSLHVHASQNPCEIEDSDLESLKGVDPKFEKVLNRNQTVKWGGKLEKSGSENVRFKSLGLKQVERGEIETEKCELYMIESEEEKEDLKVKNQNMDQLKRWGTNKQLENQTKQIIQNKLNFMKKMSSKMIETEAGNKQPNLSNKFENSRYSNKEKLSIRTDSKQRKTLVQMSSFQVESQSSILRNTILKNLVHKYCRNSVIKQSRKDSSRNSTKRQKNNEILIRKIEELTKANKDLMQKNQKLENNQKMILERMQKFSDFVENFN